MTCTVIFTLHVWDTVVEVEEREGRTPQWAEANVTIPLVRGDAPFDDNDHDHTEKVVTLGRCRLPSIRTRGVVSIKPLVLRDRVSRAWRQVSSENGFFEYTSDVIPW